MNFTVKRVPKWCGAYLKGTVPVSAGRAPLFLDHATAMCATFLKILHHRAVFAENVFVLSHLRHRATFSATAPYLRGNNSRHPKLRNWAVFFKKNSPKTFCYKMYLSCIVSPVSRLLAPVSRLLSHVSCLTSPVSCILSLVSCLLSHIFCLTSFSCIISPVSHLLSHVSCLPSHVSPLLSHVSSLTSPVSHLLPLISCPRPSVSLSCLFIMSLVSCLLYHVSCIMSPGSESAKNECGSTALILTFFVDFTTFWNDPMIVCVRVIDK